MYKIVAGVDVSKEVLDIAYSNQNQTKYLMQVPNSIDGILQFLTTIKKVTKSKDLSSFLVCFENTGTYSKRLLSTLLDAGIDCIEENPMNIKAFFAIQRGKRDDWDACRISEYAFHNQARLVLTKATNRNLIKLKHLFSYRALLVDKIRAFSNAVKEKSETIDMDLIQEIHSNNQEIIELLREKLRKTEKTMLDIVMSDEKLKENYTLATSVIGIGMVIGLAMLIKTENFTKFTDYRKFASQIGIAPFPHQSGKYSKPNKISKRADRPMKAIVSGGVNAAINHDPVINAYYNRLKIKNKPPAIIRNNIKNKLIQRVFAIVQRKVPYVKIAA